MSQRSPLALVDHVDVLTDGNSAIYGSDAVGGVVNFVLKHDFDGAQTDAYYGAGVHGGQRTDISQIVGQTFSKGGFVLAYDYAHETEFNLVRAGFGEPTSSGSTYSEEPLAPDTTRHTLYGAGRYEINDSVQIYGDAQYVWRSEELSQTLVNHRTLGRYLERLLEKSARL